MLIRDPVDVLYPTTRRPWNRNMPSLRLEPDIDTWEWTADKMDAEARKNAAVEFIRLVGSGRAKEAKRLFSADAVHHDPYLPPGVDTILGAMEEAAKSSAKRMPDGRLVTKHVVAERNLVVLHTVADSERLGPRMAQVHIFRFSGDKIAEYWDVTQMLTDGMPDRNAVLQAKGRDLLNRLRYCKLNAVESRRA